ncbi:MAG: hypothetical protein ABJQ14_16095 [Hyphomicrobiales bacterium]
MDYQQVTSDVISFFTMGHGAQILSRILLIFQLAFSGIVRGCHPSIWLVARNEINFMDATLQKYKATLLRVNTTPLCESNVVLLLRNRPVRESPLQDLFYSPVIFRH